MSKTISFVDLVLARQEKYLPDRNAPAITRTAVRVTEDDLVWVMDLAMIVLNTNSLKYAECMIRGLNEDGLFTSRIIERCLHTDGRTTKLLNLENAVLFIKAIPGVNTPAFLSRACEILTNALAPPKSKKRKRGEDQEDQEDREDREISYMICTQSSAFPEMVYIGETDDVPGALTEMYEWTAPKPHRLVAMVPTYYPIRDEKTIHAFFDDQCVSPGLFKTSVESVQRFFKRIKADFDEEHRDVQ